MFLCFCFFFIWGRGRGGCYGILSFCSADPSFIDWIWNKEAVVSIFFLIGRGEGGLIIKKVCVECQQDSDIGFEMRAFVSIFSSCLGWGGGN
uniref:Secreted protein n=1 Tax=Rhipicephalus appendiculatus TaxID=34631 RepID=A0A131YDY4_RHIAP